MIKEKTKHNLGQSTGILPDYKEKVKSKNIKGTKEIESDPKTGLTSCKKI